MPQRHRQKKHPRHRLKLHRRRLGLAGVEQLEDRRLLAADFGDAPDTEPGTGPGNYQTLASDNGPSNAISELLYLGTPADPELDAFATTAADGDDNLPPGLDDESGIGNPAMNLTVTVGSQPTVGVNVTNLTNQTAMLYGWIDTNGDGSFDNETERAEAEVPNRAEAYSVPLVFPVVSAGFHGQTYARFRLSTGPAAQLSVGASDDPGEVEDYVAHVVLPLDGAIHCASCDIRGGNTEPLLHDYRFGQSLAFVGDINGDGFEDLAAGIPGYHGELQDEGAVEILFRNEDGDVFDKTTITGAQVRDAHGLEPAFEFGSSLASLGDLDGDEIPELAVGAPFDGDNGAVFVLFLDFDGAVKTSTLLPADAGGIDPDTAGVSFGLSLATVKESDNDGMLQLAVGSVVDGGSVHVLTLDNDLNVLAAQRIGHAAGGFGATQEAGEFGAAVAALGDFNEDGVRDLAIGEPGARLVHLVYLNLAAAVVDYQSISSLGTGFGRAITTIGDVDSVGVTDLAVASDTVYESVFLNADRTVSGTRLHGTAGFLPPAALASRGAVIDFQYEIIVGFPTDRTGVLRWEWRRDFDGAVMAANEIGPFAVPRSTFGTAAVSIGDLDKNGVNDFAVTDREAVFVLFMNSEGTVSNASMIGGPSLTSGVAPDPDVRNRHFGQSIVSIGDLNRDGITDLLVGAPAKESSATATDAVYVVFLERDGTAKNWVEVSPDTDDRLLLNPDEAFGSLVTSLGDLDGDGTLEVAVGSSPVRLLSLNSTGTAASVREIAYDDAGQSATLTAMDIVAIGDVNGDGTTDLAASQFDAILVLLMNTNGSVGAATRIEQIPAAPDPWPTNHRFRPRSLAALGDFDGDGVPDIAIDDRGAGVRDVAGAAISVPEENVLFLALNSDGSGKSTYNPGFDYHGKLSVIGDQDGDGDVDLLTMEPGVAGQNIDGFGSFRVNQLQSGQIGDLGDAPDGGPSTGPGNYQTQWTDDGPVHINYHTFWTEGGLVVGSGESQIFLGSAPATTEAVSAANPAADGDDDDGLLNPEESLSLTGGATASLQFTVTNMTTEPATLYGWIDTNFDGVFDNDTERASTVVAPGANGDTVSVAFPSLPTGIDGKTYARFRISADEAAASPTGVAIDGEVEDYPVDISSPESVGARDTVAVPPNNSFSKFGGAVASLGDVDNDGVGDLAVGSYQSNQVSILLMREDGTVKSRTHFSSDRSDPFESFGSSLAAVGDLDNDGITELAVGAFGEHADNGDRTGAVHLVFLGFGGVEKSRVIIGSGLGGGPALLDQDSFGSSVAAIDLNNDGLVELAVGARRDSAELSRSGSVYVLFLNPTGIGTPTWQPVQSFEKVGHNLGGGLRLKGGEAFGSAVAAADINGDLIPDLVVGSPDRDAVVTEAGGPVLKRKTGAVHLLFMNDDGSVASTSNIGLESGIVLDEQDRFGFSIAELGDDDGMRYLAVGAIGDDTGGVDHGAVHLLLINADATVEGLAKIGDGIGGGPDLAAPETNLAWFGSSLAALDDLDGNGIKDLAVGAREWAGGEVHLVYLTREAFDYSDAPKSYSIASHATTPALMLGGFVDSELQTNPNDSATGDDLVGGARSDEDGLVDPARDLALVAGQNPAIEVLVTNTIGAEAALYGWIDLNGDSRFDEHERAEHPIETGSIAKPVVLRWDTPVPSTFAGITYARFRLSTDPAAQEPDGHAIDGEVEDHIVAVPDTDYGDAPDVADGVGPSHKIGQPIYLGGLVDAEIEGVPSGTASSDDFIGSPPDDEDGLIGGKILLVDGEAHTVSLTVTNLTETPAKLYGWIDVNGNGFADDIPQWETVAPGTFEEIMPLNFPAPNSGFSGQTYARFRLSTDPTAANPVGAAIDGEVEDYEVTILNADFGDAPDSYNEVSPGVAARPSHRTGTQLSIGTRVDLEVDAFPGPSANGDDLFGVEGGDEDGVMDPDTSLNFVAGGEPTVQVSVTNGTEVMAKLYGWIDLDLSGDFDSIEFREADVPPGMDAANGDFVSLTFPAFSEGKSGTSYARFRLSTDGAAAVPTGQASDGEVEDYLVNIANLDFGDAPDTGEGTGPGNYETLEANDGPVHQISLNIFMGSGVDAEPDSLQFLDDGRQRLSANGDDESGALPDDEDGLANPAVDLKLELGEPFEVGVEVTNHTGHPATLYGWIDFNMNGVFEDSERSISLVPDNTNKQVPISFLPISVDQQVGTTYARFRLTTDQNVQPVGFASDGEVEDYVVTISGTGDGTIRPAAESRLRESVKIDAETENLSLDASDLFGSSVAVGDLDRDGVLDLAVGAPMNDSESLSQSGAVHLLMMNPDGKTVRESVKIAAGTETRSPLDSRDWFGWSVAVGDLDRDGVLDLAVGAVYDGLLNRGAVHLLLMNPDGKTIRESVKIAAGSENLNSLANSDWFGSSVAVGDLDNDGVLDLAVGAQGDDSGGLLGSGAVHVLFMKPDGKTIRESVKIAAGTENLNSLANNDWFGSSVAVGDLDNDGVLDVAVGATGDDSGALDASGAVHLLLMNSDGATIRESVKIAAGTENLDSLASGDWFGSSVAVGDLDDDGVLDLAVGARGDDSGGLSANGAVHLLLMNSDGKTIREGVKIAAGTENLNPLTASDQFGSSVGVGDLDEDGVLDLAVGAWLDDSEVPHRGAVHLLFLDLQVSPETVAGAIEALPESPPEAGFLIEADAGSDSIDEWILAIAGDGTEENPGLPEFPRPNEVVTITLNLESGNYDGLDVSVPSGYKLVINGDGEAIEFVGASPALTVVSGDLLVTGNVKFSNATDAPTILVEGGRLTLRGARIEETTVADRPAIEVIGGTVNLGTVADPGGNTFMINGSGDLIHNASSQPVAAIGNTFQQDHVPITSHFELEQEILDGLDNSGTGLVTYAANNVYFTIDEGVRELDLETLVADVAIEDLEFEITAATGGTAVILADEKTARFTAFDNGLADFSYALTVGGEVLAERRVNFLVKNVPPVVDLGEDRLVTEGDLVTFDGAFTDAGSADTHTFLWQASTSNGQIISDGMARSFGFTPVDNGIYTVTYQVTDDDGSIDSDLTVVTVNNAPPVAELGPDQTVDEGTTAEVSFSGRFDPSTADAAAGFHYAFDFGNDGSIDVGDGTYLGSPDSATQAVPAALLIDGDSTLEVMAWIIDKDGGATPYTTTVEIANVPPAITSLTVSSAEENGLVNLTGTFSDAGTQDTHDLTVEWGDGASWTVPVSGGEIDLTHQYLDDNPTGTGSDSYTISVTLVDDDTGATSDSAIAVVTNVDPTIDTLAISATRDNKAQAGDTISVNGSFSDVGTLDTHSAMINWGDGTSLAATIDQVSGTIAASHTYATGGIFEVVVTLTDDDAGQATDTIHGWVSGVRLTADGTLQVVGTTANDRVDIERKGQNQMEVKTNFTTPKKYTFYKTDVSLIHVVLCEGNDDANVHTSLTVDATLEGGAGKDRLKGGGGNDTLIGGTGKDALDGHGGNDTIDGGPDDDKLDAGAGDDTIVDLSGNNDVKTGQGNDSVTTGDGDDEIHSAAGNDVIYAGDGKNKIHAGQGNNLIVTGDGDDKIDAAGGDDVIEAGAGRNKIQAGHGQNTITTGDGDDHIDAGGGADLINAGAGNNKVHAGHGQNTIATGTGDDDIDTGAGNDVIDAGNGLNKVRAGNGHNKVSTGSDADRIDTGSGNDTISAGAGNDTIRSGGGDDLIVAGDGDDRIHAGNGDDLVIGGRGADLLVGDAGADLLIGGFTTHDSNLAALALVLAEWLSPNSDDDRTSNLRDGSGSVAGLNGAVYLQAVGLAATVFDDGDLDTIKGKNGRDWMFADLDGLDGDDDLLPDLQADELWEQIMDM